MGPGWEENNTVLSQAQRYQKQVRKQVQISEEDTTISLGYAHMIFSDW